MPPNKTDQVQPIDRGIGRLVKFYIGEFLDEWLDDDANLEKYEGSDFSASGIAQWYCKAYRKACNKGVRKYFEHAGALMTADGSGDDLIKLEGVPAGHKFTF